MDDEDTFSRNLSNPNFRLKASKSSRQKLSPGFSIAPTLVPYVNHLVCMSGGRSIVAGLSSPSNSLVLFDAVRGCLSPHRTLHTHPGSINAVKSDPQDTNNILWSCGSDGRVQGIDLRAPDGGNVCSLRGEQHCGPVLTLWIEICRRSL
jgi:WD40 repeat protein